MAGAGGGVAAAVSLVLVGWHGLGRGGPGDGAWVAVVYGLWAVVAMVAARWLRRGAGAWVGCALASVGWEWATTLLSLASAAGAGLVAAWWRAGLSWGVFCGPLLTTMWAGSMAAALLLVARTGEGWSAAGDRGLWLAGLWLVLGWLGANRMMFTLGQAALAAGAWRPVNPRCSTRRSYCDRRWR